MHAWQALERGLEEGEELMEKVKATGQQVILYTSKPGQSRIQQDTNAAAGELQEFTSELRDARNILDNCVQR